MRCWLWRSCCVVRFGEANTTQQLAIVDVVLWRLVRSRYNKTTSYQTKPLHPSAINWPRRSGLVPGLAKLLNQLAKPIRQTAAQRMRLKSRNP